MCDWSSDVCSSDLYFFTDIRKEGIVLYELDDEPLVEPRPRTAKEAYATAKEHFEERLPFAASMMKSFRLHLDDNELRQAAFLLHQAIEHGYSGLRSEEHTSELQSLMRISYAVFCLKKTK